LRLKGIETGIGEKKSAVRGDLIIDPSLLMEQHEKSSKLCPKGPIDPTIPVIDPKNLGSTETGAPLTKLEQNGGIKR
jgi:hypothetical protein